MVSFSTSGPKVLLKTSENQKVFTSHLISLQLCPIKIDPKAPLACCVSAPREEV